MTTAAAARTLRSTRFVLVSDTDGHRPLLPRGDVLCHARGLSKHGDIVELRSTLKWIDEANFEVKIIIAVFGSPYMPKHNGKDCAFGYERQSTAEFLWSHIPLDTDILLTHTPAHNHRDASTEWQAAGCEVLRKALWQVRPRLAVCGRIREARGLEKVQWQLGQIYPPFWERQKTQYDDPDTKANRWSALDVTSRGVDPLLNDGAPGQQLQQNHVSFSSEREQSEDSLFGTLDDNNDVPRSEVLTTLPGSSNMTAQTGVIQQDVADVINRLEASQNESPGTEFRDRNREALSGRLGRQETLIVNASIEQKARHLRGRPRPRTPIVVDIELPVGDEFA
ncbi:hypothetical protein KCU65_g4591, partial [Aureobasidium melanogenum]